MACSELPCLKRGYLRRTCNIRMFILWLLHFGMIVFHYYALHTVIGHGYLPAIFRLRQPMRPLYILDTHVLSQLPCRVTGGQPSRQMSGSAIMCQKTNVNKIYL